MTPPIGTQLTRRAFALSYRGGMLVERGRWICGVIVLGAVATVAALPGLAWWLVPVQAVCLVLVIRQTRAVARSSRAVQETWP